MPSAFENEFAASALPGLYERFGTAGNYHSPIEGAAAVACSIRVQRHEIRQMPETGLKRSGELQTADLMVQESEVSKPARGGRFNVDGEVWSIEATPVLKCGQYKCPCAWKSTERHGERKAIQN